jgi:tetratricopeptide (TPR) repeat protein
LGTTYAVRIAYGHGDYETEYPLAKAAAEKALALDDQSPAAHSSMGLICAALELQIKKGVIHTRRAYELAPNDSAIVSAMATCEMVLGNFDRAIHLAEKSINLDPLDSFGYREYGRILSLVGNYDEALKMYNKALEMSPDSTMICSAIGGIKVSLEQYDEALDSIENEKVAGYRYYGKAIAFFAMGRRTESDQCLEELISEHERSNHWSFQIAIVYAFKGETDKAFEWLERAYDDHDAGVPMTKVTRHLKSLHADPRWDVFLDKIGLAN